jgi:hypothetical protein
MKRTQVKNINKNKLVIGILVMGIIVVGTLVLAKPSQYPVVLNWRGIDNRHLMVEEGKYSWWNSVISGSPDDFVRPTFVRSISVEVKLELVHLNKVVSSAEVEAYLIENGMRAATIKELLAFGATYPDVQREFPVIALGATWIDQYGGCYAPYLDVVGSERHLDLSEDIWDVRHWAEHYRFLAVRK